MKSCGPLHIDEKRLNDQLEPIYNSSVPIQDVALKTSQKWRTKETGGERGPGRSVLAARRNDDDDDYMALIWLIFEELEWKVRRLGQG